MRYRASHSTIIINFAVLVTDIDLAEVADVMSRFRAITNHYKIMNAKKNTYHIVALVQEFRA
jgi:hypothetical protein